MQWRKKKKCYRVVGLVPVPNENSVITIRIRKWHWNPWSAKDSNASKTSTSFVKCKRWEVVKASNLILHLKYVSEILPWCNGARCSKHTIFKWVSSLLNPIPVSSLQCHPLFSISFYFFLSNFTSFIV